MKKESGLTVLSFIVLIAVVLAALIGMGEYSKKQTAAAEEARRTVVAEQAAKAAREDEALKQQAEKEAEAKRQLSATELCHSAVTKRAKFESKARITSTAVNMETDQAGMMMYVISGKIDMMNGYGAQLPNNYLCRVSLSGTEFVRSPSVAGEDEGDNPEKAELNKAFKTLGLDPDSFN